MPQIRSYNRFDTIQASDAFVVDREGVGTGYVEGITVTTLTPTGVIAGSYTLTDLTVNEYGQITTIANGSAPGTGTVTSVALSLPAFITVSGSPVTGAGTLTGTLATQLANLVFAGPTSGGAAAPTFRSLVAADLPLITVPHGGTGVTTLAANGVVIGQGTSNVTVTGPGTSGQVLTSNGIGIDPTFQPIPSGGVSSIANQWFGDGSDGVLTSSSGTTTLTRDTYYSTITLSGTGKINTAGYRLFANVNLDMSNAGAGSIFFWSTINPLDGQAGVNNSGGAQGVQASQTGGTVGGAANTTQLSPNGGTGAGTQATAVSAAANVFILGVSGSGGAGGAVGGTAGGIARPGLTATNYLDLRYAVQNFALWDASGLWRLILGGVSAPGGSSGAGDGVGSGGGGGGGGGGAGIIQIFAATITRGGSTAAGAITVKGGSGGTGGPGISGTNRGGGGGGGGASGGLALVYYGTLAGSTATNMIDASGGAGGAGGNGTGTGGGGNGGDAGGQGGADLYDITTGTSSINRGNPAKVAGNAAVGGTGGAATSANTYRVSL